MAVDFLASVDRKSVLLALFEKFKDDPLGYRKLMIGQESTPQQDEVLLSVRDNKKTLVQAGHGVGKTNLTASAVQWNYDCYRPSITLTTAPNWSSVVQLLWAEIASQRRGSDRLDTSEFSAFWDGTPTRLRQSDLHYAMGHNAKSGEGFQGRHEERVFIGLDEGPGVPTFIWAAVNSMLQSDLCRLLVIGNPTVTSGPYYDAARDPSFHVIRMNALDHPNIAAELVGQSPPFPKAVRLSWVRDMIAAHCMKLGALDPAGFEFPVGSGVWWMPNDEFRSRVMGLFPKQAANAVWDESIVEHARTHQLDEPDIMPEVGCDVARFGDDRTAIYCRRGPVVLSGERHSKRDTVEVAKLCIERAQELGRRTGVEPQRVPIKVDDSGVGGGTTDYLREQKFNAIPVNSANVAMDEERYPNKRSELWYVVSERAKEGRLDLTRLDIDSYNYLKKDLLAPTYKLDGRNRRVVESKDDMKKRLQRSPDDADGFNLAFAPPIDFVTPLVAPITSDSTSIWPS